jgi:hypothetical protein
MFKRTPKTSEEDGAAAAAATKDEKKDNKKDDKEMEEGKKKTANMHRADRRQQRKTGISLVLIITLLLFLGVGPPMAFTLGIFVVFSNASVLTVVGVGLIASLPLHHEWRACRHNFDDPYNSKECHNFNHDINLQIDLYNLAAKTADMGRTMWNYFFPALVWCFQFAVDIIFALIRFILTHNLLDITYSAGLVALQVAESVIEATAGMFSDLNGKEKNQSTPNEQGTFSASTDDDPNKNPGSIKLVIQTIVTVFRAVAKFLGTLGPAIEPIINFFSNDFLKFFPKMFKAIASILKIFGNNGPLNKFFKGILDVNFKVIDNILGLCQSVRALTKSLCNVANLICSGAKETVKTLSAGTVKLSCPTCNPDSISGQCAKKPKNKAESSNVVQAGLCDQLECTVDFIDFFTVLAESYPDPFGTQGGDCDFWLHNSTANLYCISKMEAFSAVNSTSLAAANIDTLAGEGCLVLHAYQVELCLNSQEPFDFNFTEAAEDICDNNKYGANFEECACAYQNPLCEESCCTSYMNHINEQVMAQLGSRTCGEVAAYFSADEIFCPFALLTVAEVPRLSDFTYQHAICIYGLNVTLALCAAATPFTRVADLDVSDALLGPVIADACYRVVNKTNVCIPAESPFDTVLMDVYNAQVALDFQHLYAQNNDGVATFVPHAFIVTDTATAPDVPTLFDRILNKQFCQQFSIVNGNNNRLLANQPWNVRSSQGAYCDTVLGDPIATLQVQQTVDRIYTTNSGTFKSTGLVGQPDGLPSFSSGVADADECIFPVGYSPEEADLIAKCSYQSAIAMNDAAEATSAEGDEAFTALSNTDALTSSFQFLGGDVSDINPNSSTYTEQLQEQEELDAAANVDTSAFQPLPFSEANDTVGFREVYVEQPAAGTFDARNPLGNYKPTKPGGRTLLSTATATVVTPYQHYQPRHQFSRNIVQTIFDYTVGLRMYLQHSAEQEEEEEEEMEETATTTEKRTRKGIQKHHWRSIEHKAWARLSRALDVFVDEYREQSRLYDAQFSRGGSPNDDDQQQQLTWAGARTLLMTNDADINREIDALFADLQAIPITPPSIGATSFAGFLEDETINNMQYISFKARTAVFPALFNYLFPHFMVGLAANSTFTSTEEIVNGTAHAKKCEQDMSTAYSCCTAKSTSYECCRGIDFCIPDPPKWIFLDRSTLDKLDKFECFAVDDIFGWWFWIVRIIISVVIDISLIFAPLLPGPARTVLEFFTLSISDIPRNMGPCLWVNKPYLFLGIFVLYFFFILFSTQLVTQVAVFVSRSNDNFKNAEDAPDAVEH